MSLVIINCAVDSLYFSYKGGIDESFFRYLERLKESALQNEEEIPFEIGDETLFIKPYGAGKFRYNVRGKNFILYISPGKHLPTLKFQMLAIALYELGHVVAFEKADQLFRSIGNIGQAKISRLDLCCDFQGWEIKDNRLHDFICRANQKGAWWQGREPNGFQFGKGDIVARIYNKTKEINVSNKNWMEAVWQLCPDYDNSLPVWRVEFQFMRPALKEFSNDKAKIDLVEDAFENLFGLWQYGINDWLSLRTGHVSRIERRPVDGNWQALTKADFPGVSASRIRKAKMLCDEDRALSQLIGYSSSLGANWNIKTLNDILTLAAPKMLRKCVDQGISFEERVNKKIELQKYEQII